ncbi:MAG: ABC-F family ATP-binding cassette domain-containing protein [Vicingaceae bacterium]
MLGIDKISILFGGRIILDEVSCQISKGDKIGLIGKNGAGKSSLLKVIAGINDADTGVISAAKELRIGYLPQEMPLPEGQSVFDEACRAFSDLLEANTRLEVVTAELSQNKDHHSKVYMDLIHEQSDITESLALRGWYDVSAKVEKVLLGLGFLQDDFDKPTSQFSGGWRMRIELAKILLSEPQLLLLDEPTNHLDIESIQWLESFLGNLPCSIILISHDITFLNKITNRTIEIADKTLYDYPLPYSNYLERRQEVRETLLSAQKNQQKVIKDTEAFINRFRAKNTKASQVQSRIKKLDKMDRIELDEEVIAKMKIRFPDAPRSGKINLELKGVSKSFDSKKVLEDVNLIIGRGEKIAFVGKNGAGKTTLSRIIMGELDCGGQVALGHQVNIGYYAQDQSDTLDPTLDVITTVEEVQSDTPSQTLRNLLGAFLFSGDDQYKKVKVLSGGEKARLALCKLLLRPVNFLVLDEPTNHLDIQSKKILKEALSEFKGSVIVVSHDREFLSGLTDKVVAFTAEGLVNYNGGIKEFLNSRKLESLDQFHVPTSNGKTKNNNGNSENKLEYERKKGEKKERNKISSKIQKLEKSIEATETKIGQLTTEIAASKDYNPDLIDEYQALKSKLDVFMKQWEELSVLLEKLD